MSESDRLEWLANKILSSAKLTKEEKLEIEQKKNDFQVNLRRRKKFREYLENKGRFVK